MLYLAYCDEFGNAQYWHRTVVNARQILEHYPMEHDIQQLAQAAGHLICKRQDALHEMCMQYQLDSITDIDL
jgi:hypothetical protein